jgi:membrane-associated phospholipid phosphatase
VRKIRSLLISLTLATAPLVAQPSDTMNISRSPLFTIKDLWVGLGFVGATVASFPLDEQWAEHLQRRGPQENRLLQRSASFFREIGHPGALIIGGTLYTVGRLSRMERIADLGLHGTEALVIGSVSASLLKSAFGRARPYVDIDQPSSFRLGRGYKKDSFRSFPSGHSVAGFAAASAVTMETTRWWPKTTWVIGPMMYGGAAMIAVSRMYNNKHWASDVFMGAAIGTFAGTKAVRYHHSHPGNKIDKWFLDPSVEADGAGGYAVRWTILTR